MINWGWFQLYWKDGLLWFRLFGKGLKIKDVRSNPLIFSERNKGSKHRAIGNILIKPLGHEE